MKRLAYLIKPKNEKGVALILALMLMVALSLLAITSFEILSGSIRIARNHKDDLRALYVAEAGIEDGVSQLRESGTCPSQITGNVGGYTYNVTVNQSGSGSGSIIDFESVGTSGNFQRTLVARARIIETPEYPNPVNFSVAVLYWKEKEM